MNFKERIRMNIRIDNMTKTQTLIHFKGHPITVDLYLNHFHHANRHHQQIRTPRTVIILPALGMPIAKYEPVIKELLMRGFSVIAADYPGCGRNKPTVSQDFNYGYAQLLSDYIPLLIQIVKIEHLPDPIILGHSLGGHLATLYSQRDYVPIIGIATGSLGLQYWNLRGKIKLLQAYTAVNLMLLKDHYFKGYKIGLGHIEAKKLMRDWAKFVLTGNFKHIILEERIAKNAALFIQFKNDPYAPMRSVKGLSRYFESPTIISLDLSHHIKGHQHSAWIQSPSEVIQHITLWLNMQDKNLDFRSEQHEEEILELCE